MSITSILNIAKGALSANQIAVQTVSHNIANVDTPGYSRQEAVLMEAPPTPSSVGLMGDGVAVQKIMSYLDQNIQKAISAKNSDLQEQTIYKQYLTSLQGIFNEDNSQLAGNITGFFNDWQALSTDPTSSADKQALASDGQNLSTIINGMYDNLMSLRNQANGAVNDQIDAIDTTISQIASLNELIGEAGTGTSQANDYIDQRNQLLQTLSGYMKVNYFTDNRNMVTVLTPGGRSLIDGSTHNTLVKGQDGTTGLTTVLWKDASGNQVDITGQVQGGSLGALISTRDGTIGGYIDNLNGLAKSITENVNYFYGLADNGAGNAFFQPQTSNYAENMRLSAAIQANPQSLSASSDSTDTTGNDVAGRIASLANETVLGGAAITSKAFASATSALSLSGSIVVNGVAVAVAPTDTLNDIAANISASGTGVSASVLAGNGGYQLVVAAPAGENNVSVVNGTLDTSSSATSLLQSLTTTLMPDNNSTGVGTAGTFTLDGHTITVTSGETLQALATDINTNCPNITASTPGAPGTGYTLQIAWKATGTVITPSGAITQTLGLSGATYANYEAGIVARVGEATKSATNMTEYNQNALTSLRSQQADVSGVSIDEEMSNLIKFQNAYQAAARLYTVANSLLQTLMQSVGVSAG